MTSADLSLSDGDETFGEALFGNIVVYAVHDDVC